MKRALNETAKHETNDQFETHEKHEVENEIENEIENENKNENDLFKNEHFAWEVLQKVVA